MRHDLPSKCCIHPNFRIHTCFDFQYFHQSTSKLKEAKPFEDFYNVKTTLKCTRVILLSLFTVGCGSLKGTNTQHNGHMGKNLSYSIDG